jgi:hypothetical protein
MNGYYFEIGDQEQIVPCVGPEQYCEGYIGDISACLLAISASILHSGIRSDPLVGIYVAVYGTHGTEGICNPVEG